MHRVNFTRSVWGEVRASTPLRLLWDCPAGDEPRPYTALRASPRRAHPHQPEPAAVRLDRRDRAGRDLERVPRRDGDSVRELRVVSDEGDAGAEPRAEAEQLGTGGGPGAERRVLDH